MKNRWWNLINLLYPESIVLLANKRVIIFNKNNYDSRTNLNDQAWPTIKHAEFLNYHNKSVVRSIASMQQMMTEVGGRLKLELDLGGSWASRWLLAARVAVSVLSNTPAPGIPGRVDWQVRLKVPPGKWCRSKRNDSLRRLDDTILSFEGPLLGSSLVEALSTCRLIHKSNGDHLRNTLGLHSSILCSVKENCDSY